MIEVEFGIIAELFRNLLKKPMTVRFPHESIPIPDGYRGEHEYDVDKCISCELCAKICPNRAIQMVEAPEKYKDKYSQTYPQIDLGKCCFCGLCEDICPKGALKLGKGFFLSTFDSKAVIKPPLSEEEIDS